MRRLLWPRVELAKLAARRRPITAVARQMLAELPTTRASAVERIPREARAMRRLAEATARVRAAPGPRSTVAAHRQVDPMSWEVTPRKLVARQARPGAQLLEVLVQQRPAEARLNRPAAAAPAGARLKRLAARVRAAVRHPLVLRPPVCRFQRALGSRRRLACRWRSRSEQR